MCASLASIHAPKMMSLGGGALLELEPAAGDFGRYRKTDGDNFSMAFLFLGMKKREDEDEDASDGGRRPR